MWRRVAVGIVVLWLTILLVEFGGGPHTQPTPIPAAAVEEGPTANDEIWTGIYYSGSKVGFSRFALTQSGTGVTFVDESSLNLRMLGQNQAVHVRVRGAANSALQLQTLAFELSGSAAATSISAQVVGATMIVNVATPGAERQLTIPITETPSYPALLRTRLQRDRLAPGSRLEATTFDPLSMSTRKIHYLVEGREWVTGKLGPVEGWRVKSLLGELESTLWLDDDGGLIREEGPLSFVMLPETAEVAMREGWPSDPSPDIARTAGVPVLGRIMDARNVGTLRLRLRGATVPIPASETQRPDGDELVLERQRLTPAMTYALPFPGAELSEFLEPTALVQSDHPRFRGLSAEILADHRDAQDAARILTSWVHSYLRKEPTVSIPNALQVLDMGKGDCNEHAILLAALLRAAGIPNRLAVGLVYEDGTFLYHAWNEVWLNGWVAADSTFGQFPADVARIKLGDGGAEAMLAILPYLGNLSVEVIAQGE